MSTSRPVPGQIVFNQTLRGVGFVLSNHGYQEIFTDPSYAELVLGKPTPSWFSENVAKAPVLVYAVTACSTVILSSGRL